MIFFPCGTSADFSFFFFPVQRRIAPRQGRRCLSNLPSSGKRDISLLTLEIITSAFTCSSLHKTPGLFYECVDRSHYRWSFSELDRHFETLDRASSCSPVDSFPYLRRLLSLLSCSPYDAPGFQSLSGPSR